MGPFLLLSTHGQVLKDSALPTLAVKIQQHEVLALTPMATHQQNRTLSC
jgi:hypothetical protein